MELILPATRLCYYDMTDGFDYTSAATGAKEDFDTPLDWFSFKQQFFNTTVIATNKFASGSLQMPVQPDTTTELFNAAGQKMATVLAQMFTRGKHRIPLTDKINKLPAGIYLLSIQAANKKTQVKLAIQ